MAGTMTAAEALARLASERNRAQDAVRHAVGALAELDMAVDALNGSADPDDAGWAAKDAAAASAALGRLVEITRKREKAAQDRFWENWDAFRQGKGVTVTGAED